MAKHNELGKRGEQLAQQWLLKHKYKLLETNWKLDNFEVDIIARKSRQIVFIEVKTRSSDAYMRPEEAVDYRRRFRLTKAADVYIRTNNISLEPRFDIISIVLNETEEVINHMENAFSPVARYY
ncbi:MAG: YraN family protein [Paludibacter sp.]|nr:YraN family protein [Bacteroidales bacterium]MCM1068518.1 YraN family protein [Prevotella sp.]MCM1353472.1 YraN family protein [Bacteroides sp.]MCM1442633.1 YraN family protein [Muribaculum sp.]MCM1481478.1 YraN family protein [Paludibacter sp.]